MWPIFTMALANLLLITPGFNEGKSECIKHMCARIKLHTCVDSVNTKNSAKRVKEVLWLYYMTDSL
jgi:hypothetical protein